VSCRFSSGSEQPYKLSGSGHSEDLDRWALESISHDQDKLADIVKSQSKFLDSWLRIRKCERFLELTDMVSRISQLDTPSALGRGLGP
jgi:hypothetical protein